MYVISGGGGVLFGGILLALFKLYGVAGCEVSCMSKQICAFVW